MESNKTIEERQEKEKQALIEILKEMPIIQVACKRAGIGRATYYRWRKEDREFLIESEKALGQGIEYINDMSESQLVTLIKEKKMPAIAMWLKNNHQRYGAKLRLGALQETVSYLEPNDPKNSRIQELTRQYENDLKNEIVKEIYEEH